MGVPLQAITLNCWDALYEGAASPARMARRQAALLRLMDHVGFPVPAPEFAALARVTAGDADRWWRDVPRGTSRQQRTRWFMDRLGLEFPDDAAPIVEALAEVDAALLDDPPPLLPGALHALSILAGRHAVAIVADVRHAGAEALDALLDRDGVRALVRAVDWSLSPAYPPSTDDPFTATAHALGVPAAALAAGARAVRLDRARRSEPTRGEGVVDSLGALVARLAAREPGATR